MGFPLCLTSAGFGSECVDPGEGPRVHERWITASLWGRNEVSWGTSGWCRRLVVDFDVSSTDLRQASEPMPIPYDAELATGVLELPRWGRDFGMAEF